ncbi:hypothetical protein M3Y98_00916500 [Aphelenchoides besseyi]|nr:hypothetical protein M3Y98_00916500 [Aphelenchoides besseyi]KAI6193519.1 hypothetical protein M3Y96_01026300 [Aphelenchoides besseyi]
MERQCSCFLILAALIQLILYIITVSFLIQQFEDGAVVRAFDIEGVGFYSLVIIFFQIFSISFGFYATIHLIEMAWKGSYGYGELSSILCKAMVAGSFAIAFLGISMACFHFQSELFAFHGLYFTLDGVTLALYCIVFIRRFLLIKEFVYDLIQTNNLNWISFSERQALDIYKLRDCDLELRAYVNNSRFGCFRRHAHAFRHSEFYQLQKWIAQIERFLNSNEPKEAISVLIRQMNERANIFKINQEDQIRYRELALRPFIFVPVDTESKYELMEFEDEV